MSQLPETITWLVAGADVICVEASAPNRIRKFLRTHHPVTWRRVPWGFDHDGLALMGLELRNLRNGIYRSFTRTTSNLLPEKFAATDFPGLMWRAAERHGVTVEAMLDHNNKSLPHARARGLACHLLKLERNLSTTQIAEIVGYSDHTGVVYWLKRTIDYAATRLESTSCQRTEPTNTSPAMTSQPGSTPSASRKRRSVSS